MDPFAQGDSAVAGLRAEVARLHKTNRELSTEVTRLKTKMSLSASPASSVAEPKKVAPRKTQAAGEGSSPEKTAVAFKEKLEQKVDVATAKVAEKYKKELEQAENKYNVLQTKFHNAKGQLEQFVLETSEREEGYKLVYKDIFDELDEKRGLIDALQKQLEKAVQEREEAIAKAEAAGKEKDQLAKEMVRLKKRGPVHKRGRETASTEREEENSAPTKEQKEESQGQAASESSSLTPASLPPDGDTVASPSSPTGVLDPYAFSAPRTVDGAAPPTDLHEVVDASVLRSNTETLKRGPKQATPTKPIEKKPKKPAKSISPLEKVLVKARFAAAEKIVIKSDPAPETTPSPAPSPSPAAAEGETTAPVQFGDHPVAQFVAVAAKTPRDGMTELCQQLEKHYSGDIYALVEHVVQYLQRQEVLKLDYMSLWNRMEFLLTMEKVSVLLPKALSAALVEGVASMETERLTTLALSLRFVVVLQANQKAMYRVPPSTWPAVTVYDATVNVLRLLCVGRSASRGEGHLPPLMRWVTMVSHLCGFVKGVAEVCSLFHVEESVAIGLPPSLSVYAIRAVLSTCVATTADFPPESWTALCDAVSWSRHAVPLESITKTAIAQACLAGDDRLRTDAILALRLAVLQEGYGYLTHLRRQIPRGLSKRVVNEMFVELFSYAVLDWKLQDPKDAQWQGAANFFNDYLQSSTFAVCNSVEEMLHAVTNTHVMVLRALICLCRFDVAQTLRDYNYKYLTSVFTWITQQRTAYSLAQKEGSTAYRTYHPLLHSVIGEELSKLADYIAA